MPQLRQNIVTGEWVVIAPERAKRPHDFIVKADPTPQPKDDCPFCPHSPAYQNRYVDYDTEQAYVIPNKFPAFIAEGEHDIRSYYPEASHFYRAKPAIGGHDLVIIKDHDQRLPTFSSAITFDLFMTLQKRYQFYREAPEIEYVMAIYNHGEAAAASVNHPHAQVFASSIVPNHIVKEKHGSERYFELNGSCVYCEMIDHEQKEKIRLLAENDDFIAFTFYAARFPFEIWILPKNHQSTFESASLEQLQKLTDIFLKAVGMLNETLKDPAFNFFIHSLPTTSEKADYYHWHLEIAPRVAKYGGFELGGGTIIDVIAPEQAAEFLLTPGEAKIEPPADR